MVDKIHWLWGIALGCLLFTFGISYDATPGMWFIAGLGLALALASTAQYVADLVRIANLIKSQPSQEPVPPLM